MRHPEWIKVTLTGTHETKKVLRHHGLTTVCEEARCPNKGACFSRKTATFMILGDRCTRNCSFCAVKSSAPFPPDPGEPQRVADAAQELGLTFVVITSVTRDDLPDGGAGHFAKTIQALRQKSEGIKTEVLTPDFQGDQVALKTVLDACPHVFNHNVETVPRLYGAVRSMADYATSLKVLTMAKDLYPLMKTKSGIMVGLGEHEDEVLSVMQDVRNAGCDFLTIGQYLQPGRGNIPVAEYIHPEVFERYRQRGLEMGFRAVVSSPLTRSSMNAGEMFETGSGDCADTPCHPSTGSG
ncbi:MAG: lipoyl synthase [Nitrospiraceae bacterium]|nr:MAG: lipoyl synthase [Nitrospiraceae bacterium]